MVKALFCTLLIFTSYLSRQPRRWFSGASRNGISVTQQETRSRLWVCIWSREGVRWVMNWSLVFGHGRLGFDSIGAGFSRS